MLSRGASDGSCRGGTAARLYTHAKDVLGETHLPHPVLAQDSSRAWNPPRVEG